MKKGFTKYFIILSIFMLFGVIAKWSYGYYTILRWITCIASILVTFQVFEKNIDWAKVVFIVITILFNPLAPIYVSYGHSRFIYFVINRCLSLFTLY